MLNFDDYLFHGLRGLDLVDVESKSLIRLSKILEKGAILNRKNQISEFGVSFDTYSMKKREYPAFKDEEQTNFNGNDYISICTKYIDDDPENAYKFFIKRDISIILNKELLNYSDYRTDIGMSGEYQIKDIIPKSFFVAIALPHTNIDDIIDFYVERKKPQEYIHQRVREAFSTVQKIKDLLNAFHYDLPVIDINTEEEVPSIEKVLNKI